MLQYTENGVYGHLEKTPEVQQQKLPIEQNPEHKCTIEKNTQGYRVQSWVSSSRVSAFCENNEPGSAKARSPLLFHSRCRKSLSGINSLNDRCSLSSSRSSTIPSTPVPGTHQPNKYRLDQVSHVSSSPYFPLLANQPAITASPRRACPPAPA